jgi:hypothetical protein
MLGGERALPFFGNRTGPRASSNIQMATRLARERLRVASVACTEKAQLMRDNEKAIDLKCLGQQ